MYVIGYDGGGTKTRIVCGDLEGRILFDKTSTGSNIFGIGEEAFTMVIKGLFEDCKNTLDIADSDIKHIFLGLSGADLESDFKRLYDACDPIFNGIDYTIENDAWIILRSGLKEPFGAVCICGTGTNSACINRNQDKAILRALSYTLGTYGGGLEIAREALHYAYRADELTYKETVLRTEIPKLLGRKNMADCLDLFYPVKTIDRVTFGSITPLVMRCANEGDDVSINILEKVAKHIALQTIGVMKQVKAENDNIPVVIGGRVFEDGNKIFHKKFEETIKEYAKKATITKAMYHPVIGAYLFALDTIGVTQTETLEKNLLESGGCINGRN